MESCDACWQFKKDVVLRIDPYQAEIHDYEVWRWLCDNCYDDLRMEI